MVFYYLSHGSSTWNAVGVNVGVAVGGQCRHGLGVFVGTDVGVSVYRIGGGVGLPLFGIGEKIGARVGVAVGEYVNVYVGYGVYVGKLV